MALKNATLEGNAVEGGRKEQRIKSRVSKIIASCCRSCTGAGVLRGGRSFPGRIFLDQSILRLPKTVLPSFDDSVSAGIQALGILWLKSIGEFGISCCPLKKKSVTGKAA